MEWAGFDLNDPTLDGGESVPNDRGEAMVPADLSDPRRFAPGLNGELSKVEDPEPLPEPVVVDGVDGATLIWSTDTGVGCDHRVDDSDTEYLCQSHNRYYPRFIFSYLQISCRCSTPPPELLVLRYTFLAHL